VDEKGFGRTRVLIRFGASSTGMTTARFIVSLSMPR